MSTVRRARAIQAIERDAWNALVPAEGFYQSHQWLHGQEGAGVADPTYLAIESGGALAAALVAYDFTVREAMPYAPRSGESNLRWCGARSGYRNVLLAGPTPGAGARDDVLDELLRTAFADALGCGYAGLCFPFLTTPALRELAGHCRVAVDFVLPAAEIPLAGSLDVHLAALGAHRRKSAMREVRQFEAAGYRLGTERMSSCLAEVAALLANTQRKYGHAATAEGMLTFLAPQANATVDELSLVFTCRDALDGLVGFSLCYPWADTLYGRIVGFDYPRLRGAYEYFNLLFYRPIAYAHEHGLRRLHAGPGSLGSKVGRGALLEPLWAAAVGPGAWASRGIELLDPAGCAARVEAVRAEFPTAAGGPDWRLLDDA